MKALYDQGILENIDVISSTSGGSYASYWLFTRHRPTDQKFGAGLFANDRFLKEICFLQNKDKSHFIPFSLVRKMYSKTAEKRFEDYEERILNSFGKGPSPNIDVLNTSIKAGKTPYLIINTSIEVPQSTESKKKKKSSRLFEITPEYRGNYESTFRDWRQQNETSGAGEDAPISFSKAVAYAAIPSMVGPQPMVFGGREYDMWDGGETENLAALGLIRRGVKNVIIVDAVQDERPFESYVTLQGLLEKLRIRLCIADIEKLLKKPNTHCYQDPNPNKSKQEKKYLPVYEGNAISLDDGGSRVRSNIYYIKMARPKAVLPGWFLDDDVLEAGRLLVKEREDQRCPKNTSCCFCEGIELDLEDAEKRKVFYTNRVRKYDHFLRHIRPWNHPVIWLKLLPFRIAAKKNPFYDYNFPNITTLELTFSADQVEALVGLGYLQTMQLRKPEYCEVGDISPTAQPLSVDLSRH